LMLLRSELEIEKSELLEHLHFASLEKIFIEERIYKDKEFENSRSMDEAVAHIDKRLIPYKPNFIREVTSEDILRLMEIKMGRILKFNSDKAEEHIANVKQQIEAIDHHLAHIVEYTIAWYQKLKDKYGKFFPRMTEIRSFDTIVATKVVEANEKLYINREEGFVGTSLRKDEYVCNCSDIDDIILFFKDGRYKIVKVADKLFVGKGVIYVNVFKKNDKRTIYNAIYQDGKGGAYYLKRFAATGLTRDKEYDLSQGKPGTKVNYFTANPNGEAEVVRVVLKPNPRLRKTVFEEDFSKIAIKGRQSMGNILTKNDIFRITLKNKGGSTLGGRQVWFDWDVLRLNYDGRGDHLGEFHSDDLILVVLKNGEYYTSNFDAGNHYEANIQCIEKFDPNKVWSVALFDADQGYPYIKRFSFEVSAKKQSFLGENPKSELWLLSSEVYPRFEAIFGGNDSYRDPLEVDVEEFIGVKSYRAKGKRISTFAIEKVNELEPTRFPEPVEELSEELDEPDNINEPDDLPDESEGDILDEITGQKRLF